MSPLVIDYCVSMIAVHIYWDTLQYHTIGLSTVHVNITMAQCLLDECCGQVRMHTSMKQKLLCQDRETCASQKCCKMSSSCLFT